MNTHSLRKVFLSIKGIYYQAEVQGEKITWLVPYAFTLSVSWLHISCSTGVVILIPLQIPSEVDVRVMLTFLELYQTLLGFVFFKLYMDEGWVYPPHMDLSKDESGAGVGAFSLQTAQRPQSTLNGKVNNESRVSNKAVKQTIKELAASINTSNIPSNDPSTDVQMEDEDEDFVPHPSKTDSNADTITLPTLKSITESASSSSTASKLFAPYSFYLSRETPRSLMEFVIRAFGGRVGWPSSSGSGSPYGEDDNSITHLIVDRPVIPGQPISVINAPVSDGKGESEEERTRRRRRKYIQPQWVMDCINAGRILPEERYVRGTELPPHLSPFGEEKGAYEPTVDYEVPAATKNVATVEEESEEESTVEGEDNEDEGMDQDNEEDEENEEEEEEEEEERHTKLVENAKVRALQKARNVTKTRDSAAVRAAELEAEAAGVDFATFDKATKVKSSKIAKVDDTKQKEEEMNKMMMGNKQRKLYEKMKYGERKRNEEVSVSYAPVVECN
jgi:pescadillo protein